jgi:hypothetical protein
MYIATEQTKVLFYHVINFITGIFTSLDVSILTNCSLFCHEPYKNWQLSNACAKQGADLAKH